MKKFIAIILCLAVLSSVNMAVLANENVFYYSFDSINNLQISDSLNGTSATVSINSVLTGGIDNMGILLDGRKSNITIPLANRNISSVSFWIKTKAQSTLFSKMNILSAAPFELFINASDRKINMNIGEKSAVGSISVEDNKWYNIVVTASASFLSVYVNGKKEVQLEDSFSFSACQSMNIGSTDNNYFRAVIDEIIGYSDVLSENDASDIYKSVSHKLAGWDNEYYPLLESYPSGIKTASNALFNNSKVVRLIDTGFEERNEISAIAASDYSENLSVCEDSHYGKFSLSVFSKSDTMLPIKESDEFCITGSEETAAANDSFNSDGEVNIATNDKTIEIFGKVEPNIEVTFLVKKNDTIANINQVTSDSKGCYEIALKVSEYGTYTVMVGGYTVPPYSATVSLSSPSDNDSDKTDKPFNIYAKCSEISLWVKPMDNAKELSFYSKSVSHGEQESTETYSVIKSDKNKDGIFEIGTDLSLGKWQKITLQLQDSDITDIAKDLYIKANSNSKWLFDDITSSYKKHTSTDLNLSEMASGNVVYSNSSLVFSSDYNSSDFINTPLTLCGTVPVEDKLSSINIESGIKRGAANIENNMGKVFKKLSPTSDTWSFESDDTFSHQEQAIYRDDLPKTQFEENATSGEYIFKLPDEYSEQRIIFTNIKYALTVETNDTTEQYSASGSFTTGWSTGDIRFLKSYTLKNYVNILAVEYRKENDSEENIFLKNGKSTSVSANINHPGARIALSTNVSPDLTCSGEKSLSLSVKDASGETVYSTKRLIGGLTNENVEMLIPALSGEYDFVFTYNCASDSFLGLNYCSLAEPVEAHWNKEYMYANNSLQEKYFYEYHSKSNYTQKKVKDAVTDSTAYAVKSINSAGLIPKGTVSYIFEISRAPIQVVRYINMSNKEEFISSSYYKFYLDYGESSLVLNNFDNFTMPVGGDVIILSVACYEDETVNANSLSFMNIDGMYNDYVLSDNGNSVYYINYLDGKKLYKYSLDSNTAERISDSEAAMPIAVSKDEKRIFSNGYIYYPESNQKELVGAFSRITSAAFAADNDLLIYGADSEDTTSLYCYANKKLTKVYGGSGSFVVSADLNRILYTTSSSFGIHEKYNSLWTSVSVPLITRKDYIGGKFLSNDNNIIYWSQKSKSSDNYYVINSANISSGASEELLEGNIKGVCDNGMLLAYSDKNSTYFLYDAVIRQSYRLFTENIIDFNSAIRYNSDSKEFRAVGNGSVFYSAELRTDLKKETYLLSFDGKKTWYSYQGGKWEIAASGSLPAAAEFENLGMTAEEVNSIPGTAFDKLISNGDSILQLDIAVRMMSGDAGYSPSIRKITVTTVREDDSSKGLFSSNIVRYDKCDYGAVESIFPVEDFSSSAQCFYLLCIGNDWLYTYKNNRIVKIPETADELLENIPENWLTIKQYGLSASELRAVPSAALTSLFTNPGYANSEFGIIYVLKADTDDTSELKVSFKLHAQENYIANDDVVIEVILNGGDKKVIDSREFSKSAIDSFMNWIEDRQNNKGDIFYSLKSGTKQFFINYYMINSINVFDRSEYYPDSLPANDEE